MSISRRHLLKQALFIAGGVTLIPACMLQDQDKLSMPLKNLKLKGSDEKTIAELAETIIPATTTPGAKDLALQQFILKMIDDCNSPEDQKTFEKGLDAFNKYADKQLGNSFTSLTAAQRGTLLSAMEAKQGVPEDVLNFYGKVKGLTIQGYLTSKHYLTKVQIYELVPGRFRGCVPISEIKKPSVRPA
jgi:hypothetical protein